MDESRFPVSSPWTFEQVMDDDFWPDSADRVTRKQSNDSRTIGKKN